MPDSCERPLQRWQWIALALMVRRRIRHYFGGAVICGGIEPPKSAFFTLTLSSSTAAPAKVRSSSEKRDQLLSCRWLSCSCQLDRV